MKKIFILLSLLLTAISICSCGGDGKEPTIPSEPTDTLPRSNEATVPRVKDYQDPDGTWHIFLKMGQMVTGNVEFTKSLLDSALSNTTWKLDYCIAYDNNWISDSLTHYYGFFPLKIFNNGTIKVQKYNDPLKYTLKGKYIHFEAPAWVSTLEFNTDYYFFAVDYNNHLKRLVTEGEPWEVMIPRKLEPLKTKLRMVWSPINE